jgi:hypothetical protein
LERDGIALHASLAAGRVTAGHTHKLIATSVHGAVDECILLLNQKGEKIKGGTQIEDASAALPQTPEGMALSVLGKIKDLPPGFSSPSRPVWPASTRRKESGRNEQLL